MWWKLAAKAARRPSVAFEDLLCKSEGQRPQYGGDIWTGGPIWATGAWPILGLRPRPNKWADRALKGPGWYFYFKMAPPSREHTSVFSPPTSSNDDGRRPPDGRVCGGYWGQDWPLRGHPGPALERADRPWAQGRRPNRAKWSYGPLALRAR